MILSLLSSFNWISVSNDTCRSFRSLILLLNSSSDFLALLISWIKTFTSIEVKRSFKVKYFSAFSFCRFKGPTCFSNSTTISPILSRFSLVLSNLRIDSNFRFLYLETPAASSKIPLLSSGLLSAKLEIFPCEIIDKESLPKPVSMIKSTISFKRHCCLLIKYSASLF